MIQVDKDRIPNNYDFIVVGTGLAGATFANLAGEDYNILMVEQRTHIAGNIYDKKLDGINVHMYGAHIFHTDDKKIWDYMNMFTEFSDYKHQVFANAMGETYQLPFNMMTFCQAFGYCTVEKAKELMQAEIKAAGITKPKNLEEQAISMVGTTIYNKLIKFYTKKQWGKECKDLPASIIKRLPIRFNFDSTYFNNAKYQGIPKEGYSKMINKMLHWDKIHIVGDENFNDNRTFWLSKLRSGGKVIYTGAIDELFNNRFGKLEYRSLRLKTETLQQKDYQGTSVVNYTMNDVLHTRIIEHKHFAPETSNENITIITKETPIPHIQGSNTPFYPIGLGENQEKYEQYKELADAHPQYELMGRLAEYKYYDMDACVRSVADKTIKLLDKKKKR